MANEREHNILTYASRFFICISDARVTRVITTGDNAGKNEKADTSNNSTKYEQSRQCGHYHYHPSVYGRDEDALYMYRRVARGGGGGAVGAVAPPPPQKKNAQKKEGRGERDKKGK